MALEEKSRRSGHGAYQELIRLRRAGIVKRNQRQMHWTVTEGYREGIREILEGRAFGGPEKRLRAVG